MVPGVAITATRRWARSAMSDDRRSKLTLQPVVLHGHVLALNVAGFVEAFTKRVSKAHRRLGRPEVDECDDRQCRLLRARGKRPCCCGAANKCDERAPPHSITS